VIRRNDDAQERGISDVVADVAQLLPTVVKKIREPLGRRQRWYESIEIVGISVLSHAQGYAGFRFPRKAEGAAGSLLFPGRRS
jgi:hypothetical protein